MASLSDGMIKMVKDGTCFVATSSKDGVPNIGPKGSVIVLDESTLAYGELTGKQSYKNLKENPRVAVAVVNADTMSGFRFTGSAEIETSGELYDKFLEMFESMKLPKPAAAVKIGVEAIYDLSAQNAGEKLS